jgi:hypothetical protein
MGVRTYRLALALLASLVAAAVITAPGAGAGPAQDSVVGSGTAGFYGTFSIDARSGPSGEAPTGSVVVSGSVSFNGPVTCLAVNGNVAVLNIDTAQFGIITMEVTDGTPDIIDAIPTSRAPGDCSPFAGGVVGVVETGNIAVVDAPPLALPTTKRDCFRGGWRDLVDDQGRPFRNQGQCVRFSVHQPERILVEGTATQRSEVDFSGVPITSESRGQMTLSGLGDLSFTATYEFVPSGSGFQSTGTVVATGDDGTITFDTVGTATTPSLQVGGTSSLDSLYTVTAATGQYEGLTGSLRVVGTATIVLLDLQASTFVSEEELTVTGTLQLAD